MEINKILTNLNILSINDVSKTSKSNEIVQAETIVANTQDVDEDSVIEEKEKNQTSDKVLKTTSKNVKENIYDQEGITYVQFTNTGCSMCKDVAKGFKELAKDDSVNANFASVNASEDDKLFWKLLREAGFDEKTAPLPIVVKYVDGKPTQLLTRRKMDTWDGLEACSDPEKYQKEHPDKIDYRKSYSVVSYFKNDVEKTEAKLAENKTAEEQEGDNKINEIKKTTSKNVKENLYNQEGITYVEFTNTGCSLCKKFNKSLQSAIKEIGDGANFLSVNASEDDKLFWKLLKDAGWTEDTVPLPVMVKYVDGKPVELLNRNELLDINLYSAKKVTKYLKNDIANTKLPERTSEVKEQTVEETTTKEAELAEDKTTEKNEQAVLKQKLDSLKQNLEVMNEVRKEITTDTLENAISNATSISDLKDVISMYSSSLDFELQINLSSVVSEFNSDDDVDSAKEQLLEML